MPVLSRGTKVRRAKSLASSLKLPGYLDSYSANSLPHPCMRTLASWIFLQGSGLAKAETNAHEAKLFKVAGGSRPVMTEVALQRFFSQSETLQ